MPESASSTGDASLTEALPGTVKPYGRHLCICTGHTNWPAVIEKGGGIAQALSQAIAARTSDMPRNVKLTACDVPSRGDGFDLLVFPDMVRYVGLQPPDLPSLVQALLVEDRVSGQKAYEQLAGQYVCVCVHANRDARCGTCGPPLARTFADAIAARGLAESISVMQTSHVGGHRFAGNVLIYPRGDWYGRVRPDHVQRIVELQLLRGAIVPELWRGRMGMSSEEQLRLAESFDGSEEPGIS